MVRVKRIYAKTEKGDGWRVLVDRVWPRGMTKEAAKADVWMKDVAPSDALRKWFGHEPEKWAAFQKKYRAELVNKKAMITELKKMEKEHGMLTLLYGATDEEHNQALLLAEFLNRHCG